jgi:hypothetical protein
MHSPLCRHYSSLGQGFHVVQNENFEEGAKETTNCGLKKIIKGLVYAK